MKLKENILTSIFILLSGMIMASINGPLRLNPENPCFFVDGTGKAVLLTGSHTWANFQDIGLPGDKPFDWNEYLGFLAENHHNFIRLWVWEQEKKGAWTKSDIVFSPLPYPKVERNGKQLFDLDNWNESYFQRLRQRVEDAGKKGIYVSVMLFQGWALNKTNTPGADPWLFHPFHPENNLQGVGKNVVNNYRDDMSLGTLHALGNGDVLKYQEAYVKKVVETLNGFDNVLFEILNEGGTKEWQYHMITYVKKLEKQMPKQHPVGMTHAVSVAPAMFNDDLWNSPADWVSPADEPLDWMYPGSTYITDYRNRIPENPGKKVVILDTDHLWGCGGDYLWAWKSFLKGLNPIFMDPWDNLQYADTVAVGWLAPCVYGRQHQPYVLLRKNLGAIRKISEEIDLVHCTPQTGITNTAFCLAKPGETYILLAEAGKSVTIDLRNVKENFQVQWFDPEKCDTSVANEKISGDDFRVINPPLKDKPMILILKKE